MGLFLDHDLIELLRLLKFYLTVFLVPLYDWPYTQGRQFKSAFTSAVYDVPDHAVVINEASSAYECDPCSSL